MSGRLVSLFSWWFAGVSAVTSEALSSTMFSLCLAVILLSREPGGDPDLEHPRSAVDTAPALHLFWVGAELKNKSKQDAVEAVKGC